MQISKPKVNTHHKLYEAFEEEKKVNQIDLSDTAINNPTLKLLDKAKKNHATKSALMRNDRTYYIRKNQTDVMAGVDYSLGCSLIHFAMSVTILCV